MGKIQMKKQFQKEVVYNQREEKVTHKQKKKVRVL